MEYYKNLYPHPKKQKAQLILGIVFIVLSLLWMLNKIYPDNRIHLIDWIYSSIFFLQGVVNILQYFGYNIDEFFGKRFIRITTDEIQYKPKTFKPEIKIQWEDITSIFFKSNYIQLETKDKDITNLYYKNIDYVSVQALKNTITEIANKKICNLNP